MTTQAVPVATITDEDVTVAGEAVHRFLSARLRDHHLVEDVCQETIARLLQARDRLDASSATPYAITVAKSILIGEARKADVARRHVHRLDRGTPPQSPEDLAVQRSDASAVTIALDALPADDRRDLVAHVVDGEATAALAARSSGTPGGVAARLARTRARMRVDYLVAARGLTLPSERCHPVLMALSAGDRRRQRSLRAAEHLTVCETCADLAPPLVERQRSLVALVPIPVLAPFFGRLSGAKRSTLAIAGASAVAVAVVVAVVAASVGQDPTPRISPTSRATASSTSQPATAATIPPLAARPNQILIDGKPAVDLLTTGRAAEASGQAVTVRRVRVTSVPADEGFWIDAGEGRRIWVQLRTGRAESRVRVRPGSSVSFTGTVRTHGADFPRIVGLADGTDAAALATQAVHLETASSGLRLGTR